MAQYIISNIRPPNRLSLVADRLIWKRTNRVVYTVKEGYNVLYNRAQENREENIVVWYLIWKVKKVLPNVRLFPLESMP